MRKKVVREEPLGSAPAVKVIYDDGSWGIRGIDKGAMSEGEEKVNLAVRAADRMDTRDPEGLRTFMGANLRNLRNLDQDREEATVPDEVGPSTMEHLMDLYRDPEADYLSGIKEIYGPGKKMPQELEVLIDQDPEKGIRGETVKLGPQSLSTLIKRLEEEELLK